MQLILNQLNDANLVLFEINFFYKNAQFKKKMNFRESFLYTEPKTFFSCQQRNDFFSDKFRE